MENSISIIIPVYNIEKYISNSIKSIINQTDKDFEVIIIDDGSTDNSIAIAQKLLKNTNINYKIIKQKNSGVSAARNTGIKHSNSNYIYFLDGDDFIDNKTIEVLKKNIIKYNYPDFIFFGFKKITSQNEIILSYLPSPNYSSRSCNKYHVSINYLNFNINMNMCSFIILKDIITNNKFFFSPSIKYGEDKEFIIKAIFHSNKIIGINKYLFYYLKRNDSADHKKFNIKKFQSAAALKKSFIYLKKHNAPQEILNIIQAYRMPLTYLYLISETAKSYDKLYNKLMANKNIISKLKRFKLINIFSKDLIYYLKIQLLIKSPKIYKKIINFI